MPFRIEDKVGLIQAHPLWVAAFAVAAINVPFGFWREGTCRFSLRWWLAVHLPVPAVVGLRLLLKLGWRFNTFAALSRLLLPWAGHRGQTAPVAGGKGESKPGAWVTPSSDCFSGGPGPTLQESAASALHG